VRPSLTIAAAATQTVHRRKTSRNNNVLELIQSLPGILAEGCEPQVYNGSRIDLGLCATYKPPIPASIGDMA